MKMNSKKILGTAMSSIGFIILLVHAAGYIFKLDIGKPALTILGFIFIIFGSGIVRKA